MNEISPEQETSANCGKNLDRAPWGVHSYLPKRPGPRVLRTPRSRIGRHGYPREDQGHRAGDEQDAEEQGDGGSPRHPQVQARQAPHRAPRSLKVRRRRGRRVRGVQVRPRSRRAHRFPVGGQVHAAHPAHRHRLRGGRVRVHHAHLHPGRDPLQRREDPAARSPRDHRGRERGQGPRQAGHRGRQVVRPHPDGPRRDQVGGG